MPDLGTKHECTSCSTKFYDLGKPEPICPKCGLNQLAEEEPAVEEPAPDQSTATSAGKKGKGKAAAAKETDEPDKPDS